MARTVITIARQYGSGAEEIASDLAQAMGVQLIERQVLEAAGAAAGVSPDTIAQAEKVPSLLERMLEYLGQHAGGLDPVGDFSMEGAVTAGAFNPAMTTEGYRQLIEDVLRRTAAESDAVIVAHGGSVVLREVPYVFKVMVCAPVRVRAARIQEMEHISAEDAEKRVRDDDKQRLDYFQTYYKVNWSNPALYDLCVNTSRLESPAVIDLIKTAHGKFVQT